MTFFNASFETVLIRYYVMMGIIIAAFFIGLPILAFLAFPVFLAAFMGIQIGKKNKSVAVKTVRVEPTTTSELQSAA